MSFRDFQKKKQLLNFIFKIFPFIDLPFGIVIVWLSSNQLLSALLILMIPINALIIEKKLTKNERLPGPLIFTINTIIFFILLFVSGKNAPVWLLLVNVTVGTVFMFAKAITGQLIMQICIILTFTVSYFFINQSLNNNLTLFLVFSGFNFLIGRVYEYLIIQQSEIEKTTSLLKEKNNNILDSINYAKRIQTALLPTPSQLSKFFSNTFVLYQPKDIVSGDFYWFHEVNPAEKIIVCGDCTGHGVPGAFMTVVGNSLLNQIIIEDGQTGPKLILSELDRRVTLTLKQDRQSDSIQVNDGIDLSLIKINTATNTVTFCLAKHNAYVISGNELRTIHGNKFSIGDTFGSKKDFIEETLETDLISFVYLSTDGYADQFGGDKTKKIGTKKFKSLLLEASKKSFNNQVEYLSSFYNNWKGTEEQIDDVCVIGINLQ